MMAILINGYERLLSFPKTLLLAIFCCTVFFSSFIPQLKIDASGDSLVLEGDKTLTVYRDVTQTFGSADFLFLAFQPHAGIYSDSARQAVSKLVDSLQMIDGVDSVVSYLDVPLLYSPPVSLATLNDGIHYLSEPDINLDLVRNEFLTSPIYQSLLTSADETTLAIQVNIRSANNLRQQRELVENFYLRYNDLTPDELMTLKTEEAILESTKQARYQLERQLVAQTRAVIATFKDEGQIFIGGVPMIVSDMLDFVRSDMMVFGSAILIFIVLTLSCIFSQLRWVLLPLLTCLTTCLLMLGGIAFVGMKLTVISANFVALLLIITLSITIHLAVRFIEIEQANPSLSMPELVRKTMRFMLKPCVYTTMTTMVAFLSLVVSGIRPVIDFGWMMTIALALALLLAFLVLPAGLLLTKPRQYMSSSQRFSQLTFQLAKCAETQRRVIIVLCVLALAYSLVGISLLKVENRFIDYFDESTDIYQGMLVIDQQLGGTLPLDIILIRPHEELEAAEEPSDPLTDAADNSGADDEFDDFDDFFEDDVDEFDNTGTALPSYWFTQVGLNEINQVHDFLDAMPSNGKVLSLATLYKVVLDITGGDIDDIQLAVMKDKATGVIANTLIKPFLSEDGQQARFSIRVKETSKDLNRSDMLVAIESFLQQDMGYTPQQYHITGVMVMYNNMLQSLYASQIMTLAAVFVAIMFMFGVLFRSLTLALLAIAPNIMAAVFVLGSMGWAGIPLDIMTITIAAITIGIGVDDTIHYVHRFGKEIEVDGDYVAAMYRCHQSIGRAMFYTSFTIIAGFSILGLSNFTPSIYFGLLTGLAMFAALIGALLVLPLMILVFKPFGDGVDYNR